MKHFARLVVGSLLSIAAFGAQAAATFSFNCITFNSDSNCASGASQLALTLSDDGNGKVDFRFANTGAQASSITDIYFDWKTPGLALTPGLITQSAGVSFDWDATPSNLPAGNAIAFHSDLGLDSNVPTQPSGINPGEWLNIAFAGSLADLVQGLQSNALQVGLHVQGFSNGGSESFVNGSGGSTVSVPEPSVLAMLGVGLPLIGFTLRRRKRTRA